MQKAPVVASKLLERFWFKQKEKLHKKKIKEALKRSVIDTSDPSPVKINKANKIRLQEEKFTEIEKEN